VYVPLSWEVNGNGAAGKPFPTLPQEPDTVKEPPPDQPAPTQLPPVDEKVPAPPRETRASGLKGGEEEC
jgi:hypothetical protein